MLATDWNAVGALIAGASLTVVTVAGVWTRTERWRKTRRAEDHDLLLMRIALFGRAPEGPLPPISGLFEDTARLAKEVGELRHDLDDMRHAVDTLVSRTEPNGGESMKDQLNRIEQHLGLNS
jgi:hypothetical protein